MRWARPAATFWSSSGRRMPPVVTTIPPTSKRTSRSILSSAAGGVPGPNSTPGSTGSIPIKPGPVVGRRGYKPMAPHVNIWLVARGINIGLATRMYFADETALNEQDPVLRMIEPAVRRQTLLARREQRDGSDRLRVRHPSSGRTGNGVLRCLIASETAGQRWEWSHDHRQDQVDCPSRLPDRVVQGADDLQSLVRDEGHQCRRRARGRAATAVSRIAESAVQHDERAWRTRYHAAQGHDDAARRRDDDDGEDRRRLQRDPAPARWHAAGRHVRWRGLRSRRRAQGKADRRRSWPRDRLRRRRLRHRRIVGSGRIVGDRIIRSGHCVGGGAWPIGYGNIIPHCRSPPARTIPMVTTSW